jgi:hypothetical protein
LYIVGFTACWISKILFIIFTIYYCILYWKDSYNPVIVAGYIDRPEYWLFRLAFLKSFGPDCRTVTLVNTSTVTIILCYCIILVIGYKPGLASK